MICSLDKALDNVHQTEAYIDMAGVLQQRERQVLQHLKKPLKDLMQTRMLDINVAAVKGYLSKRASLKLLLNSESSETQTLLNLQRDLLENSKTLEMTLVKKVNDELSGDRLTIKSPSQHKSLVHSINQDLELNRNLFGEQVIFVDGDRVYQEVNIDEAGSIWMELRVDVEPQFDVASGEESFLVANAPILLKNNAITLGEIQYRYDRGRPDSILPLISKVKNKIWWMFINCSDETLVYRDANYGESYMMDLRILIDLMPLIAQGKAEKVRPVTLDETATIPYIIDWSKFAQSGDRI